VVAAWNGSSDDQQLTYAVPGHPEYRRYGPSEIGSVLRVRSDIA